MAAWTACFSTADIPVLRDTADSLEALRLNEDQTDANSIGEMISVDPLMTLKVLAYESGHRGRRVVTPAETVTSALVMMGIPPFFRAFGKQPAVEDWLEPQPGALTGLRNLLKRAHRGADFALAFAIHRTDPDAAVIHASALLRDFAEMLLWCHAPDLALRIEGAQLADSRLRSSAIQIEILNVELSDLQRTLTRAWRLPPLFADVTGPSIASGDTSARIVELATRLARHSGHGWDDAAIPDDVSEIAGMLNLSPAAALELIQQV
ncbi:MAG: HDOD domain-containing protein [Pseudomonadota bacterium]|nr:HDOD domain-containing protein [Pseudomonadota bacterium]